MKRLALFLSFALCVLAAPPTMAQSNLGLKGVGLSVGFVSPEHVDGTFSIGALADWGTMAPRIGLESRLEYWSHTEEEFGFEASVSDVALGARGKYYFETTNPSIRPFAGAGLALHFIGVEVVSPPQGPFPAMSSSDSETRLGIDLGGGIATSINPRTDFLGEAWYGIVEDASQFSLRAGVSFKVGQ